MDVQNPVPVSLASAFAKLEPLANKLVRGSYNKVVGCKKDDNTVYRDGVSSDEFKGVVSHAHVSKDGNLLLYVRNMNRITPGDRMSVTDEQLMAAAADPRLYKNLPGEFKFRAFRFEGIRKLDVCLGGHWRPVL